MEPILPNPQSETAQETSTEQSSVQDAQYETPAVMAPESSGNAPPTQTTIQDDNQSQTQQVMMTPDPTTQPQVSAQDDNQLIADDVDVIEKEWVDKAKKIVSSTKDNPYQQEKEVSRLQADYLMKRYGKQVKLTE